MRFKGEVSTAGSLAFKCCLCKPYPLDCSQTHDLTVASGSPMMHAEQTAFQCT